MERYIANMKTYKKCTASCSNCFLLPSFTVHSICIPSMRILQLTALTVSITSSQAGGGFGLTTFTQTQLAHVHFGLCRVKNT